MKLMKRQLFTTIILCLTAGIFAQDVHSQIAMTRAQDEVDRQEVVAATLNLSETDSAAFWPLYKEYRNAMSKPDDRIWKVLIEFADKYDSMNDIDASKMLDEVLSIEKQRNAIKTKWMKTMRKTIPATTVARFYQIDNKIDTLGRLDAAANIPLVQREK